MRFRKSNAAAGACSGLRQGKARRRRTTAFCSVLALVLGLGFPQIGFCDEDTQSLRQKVYQELWDFKQQVTQWLENRSNGGRHDDHGDNNPASPAWPTSSGADGLDSKPTGRHSTNPNPPLNNTPDSGREVNSGSSSGSGSPSGDNASGGSVPVQDNDASGGNEQQPALPAHGGTAGGDQKPNGRHSLDPNPQVDLPADNPNPGSLVPPLPDDSDKSGKSPKESAGNLLPSVVPVPVNVQLPKTVQNSGNGPAASTYLFRRALGVTSGAPQETPSGVPIGGGEGASPLAPHPQAPAVALVSGLSSPNLGETMGDTTGGRGVSYGLSTSVLGTMHPGNSTAVGMSASGRLVLPLNKPIAPAGTPPEAPKSPAPSQIGSAGHMVGLDNDDAMQKAHAALDRNPRDSKAWDVAAQVLLKENRYSEAEQAIRNELQGDAGDEFDSRPLIKVLMLEGRRGDRGKLGEAANIAVDAAGRTNQPDYYRMGAQAQWDLGHPEKAEALIHSGVGSGALSLDEAGRIEKTLKSGGRIYDPEDRSVLRDDIQDGGTRPWSGWKITLLVLAAALGAWGARRALRQRMPTWKEVVSVELSPASGGAAEGRLAGKYELVRAVAAGGMGEVYEARDHSLGRIVAVKKVSLGLSRMTPEGRSAYLRETRAVAALQHPGIVRLYEIWEQGEDVYLVMEFVRGKTVAQIAAERKGLPLPQALRILDSASKTLEFARTNASARLTLRPSDIMLADDGQVKLMGVDSERSKSDGDGYVHALGASLYQMLTGNIPSPIFLNPTSVRPDLSQSVDVLLRKALQPTPEVRLKGPAEFMAELQAAAQSAHPA